MLAAAEADFQPHVGHRQREERARIGDARADVDGKTRQQLGEKLRLMRTQRLALAAAVESAAAAILIAAAAGVDQRLFRRSAI